MRMNAQHTPGPWRVGSHGPNGCYTVGTEKGLMTAMIAHSVNYPDQSNQAVGDACLISAAPDLLEALAQIVESADRNQAAIATPILMEAKAAIAKATGATS